MHEQTNAQNEYTRFVSVYRHKVHFGQSYYTHSGPLACVML